MGTMMRKLSGIESSAPVAVNDYFGGTVAVSDERIVEGVGHKGAE